MITRGSFLDPEAGFLPRSDFDQVERFSGRCIDNAAMDDPDDVLVDTCMACFGYSPGTRRASPTQTMSAWLADFLASTRDMTPDAACMFLERLTSLSPCRLSALEDAFNSYHPAP